MINLLDRLNSLCFYRDLLEQPIIKEFYELIKQLIDPDFSLSKAKGDYYKLRSMVGLYALDIKNPTAKNVWGNIIIDSLTTSNNLTLYLEKNSKFIYKKTLLEDLSIISDIYNFDFSKIIDILAEGTEDIFTKKIFNKNSTLAKTLEQKNASKIYTQLKRNISINGLGFYKSSKAYRLNPVKDNEKEELLLPVNISNYNKMNDLIGYQKQKDKLIQNTRSFINGTGGLNTLLYGEMGTGKSTMVRSLLDEFKDTRLRFIEIKKEEISYLPEVTREIAKTNYPFIIFIDDLSFENGDPNYKALKNSLEGSFESLPENVLLYATSNKRTLVSQSKSEREDAVNAREILEEKLSLVSRFGLTIPFNVPNQDFYLDIVENLAKKNNIKITDDLKDQAIQWELRHMNRSGRTAEQFIQYINTENNLTE